MYAFYTITRLSAPVLCWRYFKLNIWYLSAVHDVSSVRYFYVLSVLVVILLTGLICCPVVSEDAKPSDWKVSYSNHGYIS
jgi:hypothetical protein